MGKTTLMILMVNSQKHIKASFNETEEKLLYYIIRQERRKMYTEFSFLS